ncbi:putative O-methyltransferase YrrM [Pullulanibacillus pueri]|uniref:O-methyltransferase n=1 Tax=Pullulanibacillus pueri TaxID=1437324 RepID=A0A8J3ENE6_9BACL|nr:O-methyltransferase [Pullulanibacillus pueri]MBM7683834.1 putative O-methyltransferase YrrM [Pullulanibacillus pueri]GGH87737.1 O-methyltransferase [Pullulanibacillus pueri]
MNANQYIQNLFVKKDPEAEAILQSLEDNEIPNISIPPETGHFMTLLIKLSGAKKALEIGALGGYSGLHILRGLPKDGTLLSLEIRDEYVDLAKENLTKAGYGENISYRLGSALDSLEQLKQEKETFDLFFIDADKRNYIHYLEASIALARPNALILVDNTLRGGRVYDPENQEKTTKFIREFNEYLSDHAQLDAIILPIGDGLAMARVKG